MLVVRLHEQGLIPAGWRLLVIESSFARSGCASLRPAGSAEANPPLETGGDLLVDANRSLAQIASGQTVLRANFL